MLLFLFRASNRRSLDLYNFASLSVGLHRGKKYWIIIPVPAMSHTHRCKHTPWFHLSLQLILQLLYLNFAFLLMLLVGLIKRKKIIVYGEKKKVSEKSLIYLPTLRSVFKAGVIFLDSFLDFVWLAIGGDSLIDLYIQINRFVTDCDFNTICQDYCIKNQMIFSWMF